MAFVSVPVDITERVQQEMVIRLECYSALSALAETRDNETGLHLKRMSGYSRCLARELGMPRKYVEDIGSFAPLHDIGKVGIPDSILLAPRKLTDEEFEIMKTHSAIGYDILKNRPTLEMAAEIAYTHHEKYNGKGYPQGLKETEIPLCGRIVAVIDVYDALRSERPYKKPWPHEKAAETIIKDSGEHFDPMVVDAFIKTQHILEAMFDENCDD
jgi:HD-GYP domain-containing protein (c-di-GMP phosphodiesterase class II)